MTALRAGVAAAFLLSSAGALFATWRSAATAERLAARAVESTAFALGASVEAALRAGKGGAEVRAILSDRVVAYALIAEKDGTVRFHVNPDLVGTRLPAAGPEALSARDRPVLRRMTLGLGTPAYAYDYPLGRGRGGETLRLVLHAGAVEKLRRDARELWITVGLVVALLAAAGVGLDRMLVRLLALRDEVGRRERLSLIGQMTATLAHEVRNALWGVKGYAQWLDEKLSSEHPGKRDVAAIVEGTGRIEELVEALLSYSREETYRLEPVALGAAVDEALAEATSGWGGTVCAEVAPGAAAFGDRDKLHRVLVNGLRNALDAMGPDGTLAVRVAAAGRFVSIEIEDTGGGVAPDAAPRLFTPFFTTRPDGSGLGLAYSRKVVEGMGGTIGLENRAAGALWSVRLPRAEVT